MTLERSKKILATQYAQLAVFQQSQSTRFVDTGKARDGIGRRYAQPLVGAFNRYSFTMRNNGLAILDNVTVSDPSLLSGMSAVMATHCTLTRSACRLA